MYTPDQPEAAPARRRIIQQPLRTEPARALIAADATQTAEIEALMKRDRPLITFPSISHFLAEPARREPWVAVVVARAGAWDPRFDSHVRRRRAIALFAPTEQVYSWPEGVARVSDLTELTAWLQALDAPEPGLAKAAEKRERRARARAALDERSANRPKPSTPSVAVAATPAAETSRAPARSVVPPRQATAALPKARAKRSSKSAQLELAISEPVHSRARTGRGPRVDARPQSAAPREKRALRPGAPEKATARTAAKERVARPRKLAAAQLRSGTASNQAAERRLMLLAAELGLVRAAALLDALRNRAAGATKA